ncbi:hypothetical protein TSAR_000947 [Trichomalopsis sarcophagae]|uniref:Uncharacterized protein n=1 Tax=Trichomalopsis sarcophagae TaxID=543379 RepID=A0A232EYI5_9HYME|nr:hypothetical protein TSAR_000947 [Trichomalopsis sarcophagae]
MFSRSLKTGRDFRDIIDKAKRLDEYKDIYGRFSYLQSMVTYAKLCQSGPHCATYIPIRTFGNSLAKLGIVWHNNELLRKTVLNEVFEISNTPKYVTDPTQAANVMEPAEDEDIVVLKKGVKCHANAYEDAFQITKCQTFFTLINPGIYGTDELAKRCVSTRGSADNNIRALSSIRRTIVEDEFYKFLVAKGHEQSKIDREMEKCSSYQYIAITAAWKKLYRAKTVIFPNDTTFPPVTEAATASFQSYNSHPPDPLFNSSFNVCGGATEKSPTRNNQQLSNTTLNQYQVINSNRSEAIQFTVNLQYQLNEQLDSDQVQSEFEK